VFRTRFRPLGTIAPTRRGAIPDNCGLICFAASRESMVIWPGTVSCCRDCTFQCRFKRSFGEASLHAIMVQAHSVALSVADVERSLLSCCAPAFEFNRLGQMHRLCCRPFCFPRQYCTITQCGLCSALQCPDSRSGISEATADSVCPLRSPAS
jgi:hypothetical protein